MKNQIKNQEISTKPRFVIWIEVSRFKGMATRLFFAVLAVFLLGTVEAGWVAGGLPTATKPPSQLWESSLAQATRCASSLCGQTPT